MAIKSKITRAMFAPSGTALSGAGATRGCFLYDNVDCVSVDTATSEIVPLRQAFTKTPPLIGRQLFNLSCKVFTDQHEATGSSIRYHDLLRAAALTSSVAGSSIWYEPIATGFNLATAWIDYNGIVYKLNNLLTDFTMSASVGEGVAIEFTGQANYAAPSGIVAGEWANWNGGPAVVQTFKSVAASIQPSGSSAYNCAAGLVLKSFTFTRGLEIAERTSACASDGLAGLDFNDARSTLEMTLEMPDFTTNLGNYYANLTATKTHAIDLQWGSNVRGIWRLNAPQAVLTGISNPDGEAGNRNLVLSYALTHTDDNKEFFLAVDNTA